MSKVAECQRFQDILLHSCTPECLEICVVPHLSTCLGVVQVASLLSLMRTASAENASYDDCHSYDKKNEVSVERMKEDNTIGFGNGVVSIRALTDAQWVRIYNAMKEWQEWSSAGGGDGDEWIKQISPNRKAYQMFDPSLSEEKKSELAKESWNSIFDKSGVKL